MGDVGRCKFKQENQSKASEQHQTLLNSLDMTKDTVHIKNMQSNKMNIIQHVAEAFYREYSDVTPFVIINIFKVTVIKLHFFQSLSNRLQLLSFCNQIT